MRALGGFFAMTLDTLVLIPRRPFAWREFFLQCWFVARVSLLPTMLLAIPLDVLLIFTFNILIMDFGAADYSGTGAAWGTVTQVGPVVTVLVVSGAGATAMCADLGSRRIRDEISAMEVMGVNPLHRLVLPRLLAATLVALLLDAVVSVAGIAGGLWFGVNSIHITASSFFATFGELSQMADLVIALVEAGIFGFIAAMVACYKGLYCKSGPKGVGDAVNQAVVVTFILSFFVNFLLTVFYFNFIPQKGL